MTGKGCHLLGISRDHGFSAAVMTSNGAWMIPFRPLITSLTYNRSCLSKAIAKCLLENV